MALVPENQFFLILQPGTGWEPGADGLHGPEAAALPTSCPRQGEELQRQRGRGTEQARQGADRKKQVNICTYATSFLAKIHIFITVAS